MISYWQKEYLGRSFDVCIVGAGFTGLATAFFLKKRKPNLRIAILEQSLAGPAASIRNAGFACYGSPSEVLADIKTMGETEAISLLKKRWDGIQIIKELFGEVIEAENNGGYELFTKEYKNLYFNTLDSLDDLNAKIASSLSFSPYTRENTLVSKFCQVEGIISITGEFGLNPYLLWNNLYQKVIELGILVVNGIEVEAIENECVFWCKDSEQFELKAEKIILTVNGLGKYLVNQVVKPARAQVLITIPLRNLLNWKGNFHANEGYYYFRKVNDSLLIGGGRHLEKAKEQTDVFELNSFLQEHLIAFANEHICPLSKEDIHYQWVGIMGMRDDKFPKIEFPTPNNIHINGLSGMGVALSFAFAQELSWQW